MERPEETVDQLVEKFDRLSKGLLNTLQKLREKGALSSVKPLYPNLVTEFVRESGLLTK